MQPRSDTEYGLEQTCSRTKIGLFTQKFKRMSFGLQGIVLGTVSQQCNMGEIQFDQFLLKPLPHGSRCFDAGAVVQSFQPAIFVTFCCVYQLQRLETASVVQFYKPHIFLLAMVADPSPDRDFVSDVRVLCRKEFFDFRTFLLIVYPSFQK